MRKSLTNRTMVRLLILLMIAATAMGGLTACGKKEEAKPSKPKKVEVYNPLTGVAGFNKDATKTRVAAVVVENTPDARPQWGIDDANSPDIILQGEVEGGITRTLWFFADQTAVPEKVGPVRSARPPFIKFSELFDSIFVHWGLSHSKGAYTGADSVFAQDGVDEIDQMELDNGGLYGRDTTRNTASEHRGVIYGDKLASTIEELGLRNEPKDYTDLQFNKKAKALSKTACTGLDLTFSSRSFETMHWTYNEEDGQYHSDNFGTPVLRENLLVLFDNTQYINNGAGTTYCNYELAGGNGKIISNGTVVDITWAVEDGKLVLYKVQDEAKDSDEDAKPELAVLNPGKTWIGWVSANNGAAVTPIIPETTEDAQ